LREPAYRLWRNADINKALKDMGKPRAARMWAFSQRRIEAGKFRDV